MKKAEEYYNNTLKWREGNNGGIQRHKSNILETIKQAQIDAIEEAVKECAKSARIENNNGKHNAHFMTEDGQHYIIAKQSILKVAEKLKKEIK